MRILRHWVSQKKVVNHVYGVFRYVVRLTLANKSGWRQAVYPYLKG